MKVIFKPQPSRYSV